MKADDQDAATTQRLRVHTSRTWTGCADQQESRKTTARGAAWTISRAAVKIERDLAQIAYDRAVVETNPRARITDEKIAKFVETMRSNVQTGDTPFRRAYIRSVIDQVEVDDDEIRIWGRKGVLERLVAASGGSGPAGVPSFVRKWRPRRDSNSRSPHSEAGWRCVNARYTLTQPLENEETTGVWFEIEHVCAGPRGRD
jgi:hypothetical protein